MASAWPAIVNAIPDSEETTAVRVSSEFTIEATRHIINILALVLCGGISRCLPGAVLATRRIHKRRVPVQSGLEGQGVLAATRRV